MKPSAADVLIDRRNKMKHANSKEVNEIEATIA